MTTKSPQLLCLTGSSKRAIPKPALSTSDYKCWDQIALTQSRRAFLKHLNQNGKETEDKLQSLIENE